MRARSNYEPRGNNRAAQNVLNSGDYRGEMSEPGLGIMNEKYVLPRGPNYETCK